jgi:hypothetical protein
MLKPRQAQGSAVQSDGRHWFGKHTGVLLVIAVLQQVAPLPQSPWSGVHVKIVMQMPTPGPRSRSHAVGIGHWLPPLVHG